MLLIGFWTSLRHGECQIHFFPSSPSCFNCIRHLYIRLLQKKQRPLYLGSVAKKKMEKGLDSWHILKVKTTGFPDGSDMSYEEGKGVHKVVRPYGITNKVSLEKGRRPSSEVGSIPTFQQDFGNTGLIFHWCNTFI